MVNSPLIRPYFLGGWHWGGPLRFPWFWLWFTYQSHDVIAGLTLPNHEVFTWITPAIPAPRTLQISLRQYFLNDWKWSSQLKFIGTPCRELSAKVNLTSGDLFGNFTCYQKTHTVSYHAIMRNSNYLGGIFFLPSTWDTKFKKKNHPPQIRQERRKIFPLIKPPWDLMMFFFTAKKIPDLNKGWLLHAGVGNVCFSFFPNKVHGFWAF